MSITICIFPIFGQKNEKQSKSLAFGILTKDLYKAEKAANVYGWAGDGPAASWNTVPGTRDV